MHHTFCICSSLSTHTACQPLTAPDNGDIDCSLGNDGQPSLGDTCTFKCDDGYELSGSNNRTCQIDGSWSGTDTVCTRGMLMSQFNLKKPLVF